MKETSKYVSEISRSSQSTSSAWALAQVWVVMIGGDIHCIRLTQNRYNDVDSIDGHGLELLLLAVTVSQVDSTRFITRHMIVPNQHVCAISAPSQVPS